MGVGLGKKWKSKKKPRATKHELGFNKLLKATSTARDQYEDEYDFAIDYDEIQTPEGMPSFGEFVDDRQASMKYGEADPLWKYTKTTQLPFGLAYQRWRGAKTSFDQKNYRSPYMTPLQLVSDAGGAGLGEGGAYGVRGVGTAGYKPGHRKQMEDRTLLQKAKALPGTILPPLNMLSGGASASGGQYLMTLPWAASMYYTGKAAAEGETGNVPKAAAGFLSSMATFYPTQSRVVIPTGGFKRNPFNKAVREIKRESKKEIEKVGERIDRRGQKEITKMSEKEKRAFDRYAKLYEKKYGFLPTIPSNTMSPTTSPYDQPTTTEGGSTRRSSRRGSNRNPIFLKDGGKLDFNNDGKVTKADFIYKAIQNKKQKDSMKAKKKYNQGGKMPDKKVMKAITQKQNSRSENSMGYVPPRNDDGSISIKANTSKLRGRDKKEYAKLYGSK